LGGAIETEILLEELPVKKQSLAEVTSTIFNGPKFSRTYVDDPEYGVPFIGGSELQHSDLSGLSLLSRQRAHSKQLRHLELKKGMTLITCSGTIGKMAYARDEMEGIWSSQHVMKVVPNEDVIQSGYLYAYLSSKFGVPLITSGTYGAIIQSIEPHHISSLSVPRFGEDIESQIHERIDQAAGLRTTASHLMKQAVKTFESLCSVQPAREPRDFPRPSIGKATSTMLAGRMDSTYYIPSCLEARASFDNALGKKHLKSLGEVASVFIPGIFKRQYASDPAFGYPYITGADVFCIKPSSDQFLLKTIADRYGLVLKKGMIVIHEAGQRYGLIGRGVMVGETLDGFACTNNMVRIMPNEPADAGYIYAVLSSEHGVRLLKREAAGSSIPHLDEGRARALQIPWPSADVRSQIAELAHQARDSWDEADQLEDQALKILSDAISKHSTLAE
jgi:type I restriction enzyme S subunit